jgi:hypothetical protein
MAHLGEWGAIIRMGRYLKSASSKIAGKSACCINAIRYESPRSMGLVLPVRLKIINEVTKDMIIVRDIMGTIRGTNSMASSRLIDKQSLYSFSSSRIL